MSTTTADPASQRCAFSDSTGASGWPEQATVMEAAAAITNCEKRMINSTARHLALPYSPKDRTGSTVKKAGSWGLRVHHPGPEP